MPKNFILPCKIITNKYHSYNVLHTTKEILIKNKNKTKNWENCITHKKLVFLPYLNHCLLGGHNIGPTIIQLVS